MQHDSTRRRAVNTFKQIRRPFETHLRHSAGLVMRARLKTTRGSMPCIIRASAFISTAKIDSSRESAILLLLFRVVFFFLFFFSREPVHARAPDSRVAANNGPCVVRISLNSRSNTLNRWLIKIDVFIIPYSAVAGAAD